MSVDVERVEDPERWNRHVDRSPTAGALHRFEALEVLADHAGADLLPLAGYVGEEPVGVFPLFEVSKAVVSTAVSPPPRLRVPYLGPAVLNMGKLSRRKAERRQREFVAGALDALEEHVAPDYVHLRLDPRYPDVRPFVWEEFDATPRHTYVVDLTVGTDDLLASFSSDARGNVRRTDPDAHRITVGGAGDARRIVGDVADRFADQDADFALDPAVVVDLLDRLPDGHLRPYVCRVDGEHAGGILVLDDGRRVARWLGGVAGGDVDVPVNDLLDWRVMTDAVDRGRETYDLVGADTERVNRYKAKFAPDLRTFYSLERGSRVVTLLARGYRKFA